MRVRYDKPADTEEMDFSPLTVGNVYWVIGIEADWYRLINDDGEPLLYPPQSFTIVDAALPAEWTTQFGEEQERYSYPPELAAPGFFEDYFDGHKEARQSLRLYLQRRRRVLRSGTTADSHRDKMAA